MTSNTLTFDILVDRLTLNIYRESVKDKLLHDPVWNRILVDSLKECGVEFTAEGSGGRLRNVNKIIEC